MGLVDAPPQGRSRQLCSIQSTSSCICKALTWESYTCLTSNHSIWQGRYLEAHRYALVGSSYCSAKEPPPPCAKAFSFNQRSGLGKQWDSKHIHAKAISALLLST
eukprot:jgi/Botrbrau1/13595/Bobra.0307s0014.1